MVNVQLGSLSSGGWADNVGTFFGQNIQNGWDSHAPTLTAFGFLMGDFCRASCHSAVLIQASQVGQPTYDADVKANACSFDMR